MKDFSRYFRLNTVESFKAGNAKYIFELAHKSFVGIDIECKKQGILSFKLRLSVWEAALEANYLIGHKTAEQLQRNSSNHALMKN